MPDVELKPCPFCGGTKLKVDSKRTFRHDGQRHCSVTVRCMKCHTRGPVVGILIPRNQYNEIDLCKIKVAEEWNKRADCA